MAAVSTKNIRRKEDGWVIYPIALLPDDSNVDHLIFALKYEGVQPLSLKKLFETMDQTELEKAALDKPTSGYIRRLCYLYEWLTAGRLHLKDVDNGAYVDLADERKQFTAKSPRNDKRFRVRYNLPGTASFCPIVFRTQKIDAFIAKNLSEKAKEIVESAPKELIARAAAFLLLSDSKASFAIEGEDPPRDRLARWSFVISKAGHMTLNEQSIINLQRDLIGDARFVKLGLRDEGGFVGRHDAMGQPVPEHISANPSDLKSLLAGLFGFNELSRKMAFHPVLAAACISFGFIYIHPFEDGNGRIHRFLMHHVLAERKYTPDQIVFPISSVILSVVARYKDVLETVSTPLLEWIDWVSTEDGNVRVLNKTDDYYRFFNATAHCEFLFRCIETAVERDLPEELSFLEHRDLFHKNVSDIIDMGERKIDLLLGFLRQNQGRLSKRARLKEFALLTDGEIVDIETIYTKHFTLEGQQ